MKKSLLLFAFCFISLGVFAQVIKPDRVVTPDGPNTQVYWNSKFKTAIMPHFSLSHHPASQDTTGDFFLNTDGGDFRVYVKGPDGTRRALANVEDIASAGGVVHVADSTKDSSPGYVTRRALEDSLKNSTIVFSRRFKYAVDSTIDINLDSAATVNSFPVFRNINGDLFLANVNFNPGTQKMLYNGISPQTNVAPTTGNDLTNKTYTDATYQPILVSGTNLKTINDIDLTGSGNIAIDGLLSGTLAGNATLDFNTFHLLMGSDVAGAGTGSYYNMGPNSLSYSIGDGTSNDGDLTITAASSDLYMNYASGHQAGIFIRKNSGGGLIPGINFLDSEFSHGPVTAGDYSPYEIANDNALMTRKAVRVYGNTLWAPTGSGVTTFNTRAGAVTLNSTDVTAALGFSPLAYARSGLHTNGDTVKSGGDILDSTFYDIHQHYVEYLSTGGDTTHGVTFLLDNTPGGVSVAKLGVTNGTTPGGANIYFQGGAESDVELTVTRTTGEQKTLYMDATSGIYTKYSDPDHVSIMNDGDYKDQIKGHPYAYVQMNMLNERVDSLLAAGPSITGPTTVITNDGVVSSLTITNSNSSNAPALTVNGQSVFNGQALFQDDIFTPVLKIPLLAGTPNFYYIEQGLDSSLNVSRAGKAGISFRDTVLTTDNGSRFLTTADLPSGGGYAPETRQLTIGGVSHNLTADQTWNAITALTGDATASGTGSVAITLATVNSNVGSFGDASHVSSFTTNAKGLTTAASSISIQIAESQVTNLTADLTALTSTYQPLEDQRLSTANSPVFVSLSLQGATGNGFINMLSNSVTPSLPSASHHLIYFNNNGQFTIVGSTGKAFSLTRAALTADRVYGLPDSAGTFALRDQIAAGTLKGTGLATNLLHSSLTDFGTVTSMNMVGNVATSGSTQALLTVTATDNSGSGATGQNVGGFFSMASKPGTAVSDQLDGLIGTVYHYNNGSANIIKTAELGGVFLSGTSSATTVYGVDILGQLTTGGAIGTWARMHFADDNHSNIANDYTIAGDNTAPSYLKGPLTVGNGRNQTTLTPSITLNGYNLQHNTSAPIGYYGWLNLDANGNFTGTAIKGAVTNAYKTNKIALLYGAYTATLALDSLGNAATGTNVGWVIDGSGNMTIPSLNSTGIVHTSSAGLLSGSLIVNADITPGTIAASKLVATDITTIGTLSAGSIPYSLLTGTPSTSVFNKVTITAPATGSTLTIADGKTFTVNNTITLAGTDAQTYTLPTTSATIARTDASNTFSGTQNMGVITANGSGGSNIYIGSANGITDQSNAVFQYAGSSNNGTRLVAGGASASNVAGHNYSGFLIEPIPVTIPSGTSAFVVNFAVATPNITNSGTITKAATAYIGAAPTAGGTNYSLYAEGNIFSNTVIQLKSYTVSTLPTGHSGDTAFVTDALTPSFGVTLVGGGAVVTKAFYNGTNWIAE